MADLGDQYMGEEINMLYIEALIKNHGVKYKRPTIEALAALVERKLVKTEDALKLLGVRPKGSPCWTDPYQLETVLDSLTTDLVWKATSHGDAAANGRALRRLVFDLSNREQHRRVSEAREAAKISEGRSQLGFAFLRSLITEDCDIEYGDKSAPWPGGVATPAALATILVDEGAIEDSVRYSRDDAGGLEAEAVTKDGDWLFVCTHPATGEADITWQQFAPGWLYVRLYEGARKDWAAQVGVSLTDEAHALFDAQLMLVQAECAASTMSGVVPASSKYAEWRGELTKRIRETSCRWGIQNEDGYISLVYAYREAAESAAAGNSRVVNLGVGDLPVAKARLAFIGLKDCPLEEGGRTVEVPYTYRHRTKYGVLEGEFYFPGDYSVKYGADGNNRPYIFSHRKELAGV